MKLKEVKDRITHQQQAQLGREPQVFNIEMPALTELHRTDARGLAHAAS